MALAGFSGGVYAYIEFRCGEIGYLNLEASWASYVYDMCGTCGINCDKSTDDVGYFIPFFFSFHKTIIVIVIVVIVVIFASFPC